MTCMPTSPEVLAEMFPQEKCGWSGNPDCGYKTNCRKYIVLARDDDFNFCPFCGKRIEVKL